MMESLDRVLAHYAVEHVVVVPSFDDQSSTVLDGSCNTFDWLVTESPLPCPTTTFGDRLVRISINNDEPQPPW